MAKDNNTLMLVALGGLAFYFWQRSQQPAPVAIASADATSTSPAYRPRGYRLPPTSSPAPIRKPMPPVRTPGKSPGIHPAVCSPEYPCVGIPEPIIDWYTPDRTVA